MNFGFQPDPASRFETRPLPEPASSSSSLPSLRNLCVLSASALSFSFPRRSSSPATRLPAKPAFGGFSLLPFNFKLSIVNLFPISPSPAIVTSFLQIAENASTLSPVFVTLTDRVKHKSCVRHSYRKHPGVGCHPVSVLSRFFPVLATHHSSLSTIPFRIRTSEKRTCNSRRIRTYEKTRGVGGQPILAVLLPVSQFSPRSLEVTKHPSRLLCAAQRTLRLRVILFRVFPINFQLSAINLYPPRELLPSRL